MADATIEIVYVQPTDGRDDARTISLERFAARVAGDAPLGQRFARSLRAWADTSAGATAPRPWGRP